jgi:predicted nucleic acid-binding protein
MTVLLDNNVLLDVLLDRHPFVENSRKVWNACDVGRIQGVISAVVPPTIFYVAEKILGPAKARECVKTCLGAFSVVPVTRRVLDAALLLQGADYEDNLQIVCAVSLSLDAICTRDEFGFKESTIPVLSPSELLLKIPV